MNDTTLFNSLRLNLKIEQELIDMGVRTTEDLDGLFEDEELLEAVTDGMSKADGIAFVKAYYRCRGRKLTRKD